jgi:hypothetical protein
LTAVDFLSQFDGWTLSSGGGAFCGDLMNARQECDAAHNMRSHISLNLRQLLIMP